MDLRRATEVFLVFLRLGLTSFGGPVAHLGYFREEFVRRRSWLTDADYADLVALCQFLPGPASSQVGMALGHRRAGYPGMFLAWLAFTLPSAVLLVAFAYGMIALEDSALGAMLGTGWLHGIKAAAVAVVAHAVLGMAGNLATGRLKAGIALGAFAVVVLVPQSWAQVAVVALAAFLGWMWVRVPDAATDSAEDDADDDPTNDSADGAGAADSAGASATAPSPSRSRGARRLALTAAVLFLSLLAGLPALAAATGNGLVATVDTFYRAGALVFGGGHVVLPFLETQTVAAGTVTADDFLAGYAAAQAVPGPLFTFASFLGTVSGQGPGGVLGALVALLAIFLPAVLLLLAALPFWERLRQIGPVRRALAGVNAAVVGLLAAALYSPVFVQGITGVTTMVIGAVAFVALAVWRVPAWAVVLGAAVLGALAL
ncbi:chromate efflux transporter [Brevibacterium litoralis]|uniref:chromate efflux transporter n=1 Tax=Brevibacterium litoralis TaxID=3138935 RepID=UPI0032ED3FCA